jgi:orotate phosphoribosyltransferase
MTVPHPPDFLTALAAGDLSVFQTDDVRRDELLADLVASAWGAHGEFIDADQFLTKPIVLRWLASILAARVPADVTRLVGREPHSLVLGTALALETGLPLVVARIVDIEGRPKLTCHGELHAGERVLVVEGVTGTGASAVEAVRAARDCGAVVVGVLAAVDRGHGAAGLLEGVAVTLDQLFSDEELRRAATRGRAR